MFNFFFDLFQEVWSAFFPSKPRTKDTSPFAFLLSPTLTMETDAFLLLYWSGLTSSPDYAQASARFKVAAVNVKTKTVTAAPELESVIFTVRDVQERRDRLFRVERTAVDEASDDLEKKSEEFFGHQDCKKVLVAVSRALQAVPPTIEVAGAAVVAGPAVSGLSAPALASAVVPPSVASTLLPPSSQDRVSSYLPGSHPNTEFSTNSIVDHATLKLTQIFDFLSEFADSRMASESLPRKNAPADDRWLAGAKLQTQEYGTERSFEAYHLNLFHMALLADLVHKEYPLYFLFKNNRYWFLSIIYLAARVIDQTLGSRPDIPEDPEDSKDIVDMFFLPIHLYMPYVAGRWMGFKIREVQGIVVKRIVRLFLRRLAEYEANVCVYLLSEPPRLLIF